MIASKQFSPVGPHKKSGTPPPLKPSGGARMLLVSSCRAKPEPEALRQARHMPRTATYHTVAALALGEKRVERAMGIENTAREPKLF
jgi:hypothetical protein